MKTQAEKGVRFARYIFESTLSYSPNHAEIQDLQDAGKLDGMQRVSTRRALAS